ncbi:SagB family peptide dehydrogenase [Candidatus Albibeggiatoa sp. nov. NOAA]|uniref:SagB family peptide dehydrogenase n=1 Tax=Candidatus Albibeggiatoa sp. nov. NOAA TaxID=3162724 RepID=UPI0032FD59E0|nr:SagB family peptide dehydrogenase [Thiotrichaceae bacterium]
MSNTPSHLDLVFAYHNQTKHHFERYANGPQHIEWENQPSGFRYYEGTQQIELPLVADNISTQFKDLYTEPKQSYILDFKALSGFLELAFGLSAWKQFGDSRWSLRCNPSSGNLHPTESYVVTNDLGELNAGVYHYVSENHILEQRGIFANSADLKAILSETQFLVGLSSIPWREAWKYGERAFRYCQHDVGHAIATVRYAAACFGWKAVILPQYSDAELSQLLGLNQTGDFHENEIEIPEILILVQADSQQPTSNYNKSFSEITQSIQWYGKANLLDPQHHYEWPAIDKAIEITEKPTTKENHWAAPQLPDLPTITDFNAADLIRQRRSAQHFDGHSILSLDHFYRMLDCTLPRENSHFWDVFPFQPRLHLVFFVHRVDGLASGLYVLARHDSGLELLKQQLQHPKFEWKKTDSCPEHLPLYQLVTANAQNAAMRLSCHQNIASHSAFSLGMLAEFEDTLQTGTWQYKRLFWEAGMIGQVLYLEAEASGMRGTGIGCFFDDAVHEVLGIQNHSLQSLYHFTVGVPMEDSRLQTIPPYAHLDQQRQQSVELD